LDLRVARLHGAQVVVADGPAHFLDAEIEDDLHARSRWLRSTDGARYGRRDVDVEARRARAVRQMADLPELIQEAAPRRGRTPLEVGGALALVAAATLLRLGAIFRYRFDSDEPQHLHVVWAWTQGLAQYRDVFDNHMPLFHLLNVPVRTGSGRWSGPAPSRSSQPARSPGEGLSSPALTSTRRGRGDARIAVIWAR